MEAIKATGFKSKSVAKMLGISLRQLDYWVRTDLIKSSILSSEGRGSTRVYSFLDLIQINTVKALLAGGMSIQKIRKSVQYVKDKLGEEIPLTARLITDGESILKVVRDNYEFIEAIDTLEHQGQGVFLISIGKLKQEVEEKVKEFERVA